MTGGGEPAARQARAPLRQRSRRRWAIVGGVAAGWVVLEVMTGSAVSATVALVVLAGLGVAGLSGLRALGITRDHPWMQRMASRPWRDGQDVLRVAMRHLPDVFVVTPSGSLLAPDVVEVQLNPADLASLCERMELGVISSSLTEVYEERVAEYQARQARPGRTQVYVTASGSVPPGRYRLRQGDPVRAGTRPDLIDVQSSHPEFAYAAPQHAYAGPVSPVWQDPGPGPTVAAGLTTIMAASLAPVPLLRLVTGSSVAETRTSGARAGRGPVELILPDVPTVSREHARFTFSDGQWWISNQGRNGLILNGSPVTGEQPVGDGDSIRWGTNPDAPLSRVEIGSSQGALGKPAASVAAFSCLRERPVQAAVGNHSGFPCLTRLCLRHGSARIVIQGALGKTGATIGYDTDTARRDGRATGAGFGSGEPVATGRLFLWSATLGEWVSCPPDEITWLDRRLLSDDKDLTLHRAPRCAGLRHVHHHWELFSRDTTYRIYLAPGTAGTPLSAGAVERTACHVLPAAPARYEALPVTLAEGSWLVSVGRWVVRLRLEPAVVRAADLPVPDSGKQETTRAAKVVRRGGEPGEDAVARVRGYFARNATARLTMAYYYQEFILGLPAPQTVPMINVVIALDLSGEGAVSDYKKLLQGFIWKERGHARHLADFLLANGLLTPADLDEARQVAAENERNGVCEIARQRLQYRQKGN